MVTINFENTSILDLRPEFFVSWLSVVCEKENSTLGDIALIFCSDNYLLELNRQYLNHDYYTDIITFDYSNDVISGDLFISVDRVSENAIENSVSFNEEINRVVVHGVLHLLGYSDKSTEEKSKMTSLENEMLSLL